MTLNQVDLFAGIGGMALAGEWAGFTPVLFCERDAYCRRVLAKHWPHVPIAPDVYTLTGAIVREHLAATYTADVQHPGGELVRGARDGEAGDMGETAAGADGRGQGTVCRPAARSGVDLLTGGFPCQPFSVAGKQRGAADDRHLWPQMLRIIEEVRPRAVVAENVAGFVRMALDDVLADLEAAGYETGAVVLPACGVGAWHRRERVFILAADTEQRRRRECGEPSRDRHAQETALSRADVPDADRGRCEQRPALPRRVPIAHADGRANGGAGVPDADREPLGWLAEPWRERGERQPQSRMGGMADGLPRELDGYWDTEPVGVPRVAKGVPDRVNRLRALGNAVVPAQVYPVLAAIAEVMA